jgi:hypothetical protein
MIISRTEARQRMGILPPRERRIFERRIREQARFSNLRTLTGDIPTLPTLRRVLGSLGTFKQGLLVPGYAEFTLSGSGLRFFKELLGSADISPGAFLIVSSNPDMRTGRPRGILFENRSNGRVCFFDLGLLCRRPTNKFDRGGSLARSLDEEEEGLINRLGQRVFGDRREGVWRIKLELETVEGAEGFSDRLSLLNLDYGVYSRKRRSDDPSAFSVEPDYQRVLCGIAEHIKDNTVVETGVGFGANLIHALRLGARWVWTNDTFHVYRQLSQWNVRFAQDTGQIKAVDPGSVEIVDSAGLDRAPRAGIYLFNAPSIRTQSYIDERAGSPLISASFCMSETDFVGIFAQLKKRLQRSDSLALWRVLPSFSPTEHPSYFTLTEGMRQGQHTVQYRSYHPGQLLSGPVAGCVIECALGFLQKQGLKPVVQGEGDIFLLRRA